MMDISVILLISHDEHAQGESREFSSASPGNELFLYPTIKHEERAQNAIGIAHSDDQNVNLIKEWIQEAALLQESFKAATVLFLIYPTEYLKEITGFVDDKA